MESEKRKGDTRPLETAAESERPSRNRRAGSGRKSIARVRGDFSDWSGQLEIGESLLHDVTSLERITRHRVLRMKDP